MQGIPGVICYLDDILVTGPSKMEHLRRLEAVLKKLKEHGIQANLDKCLFMQNRVEYLGQAVDNQGFRTSPKKVQALVKAPPATRPSRYAQTSDQSSAN